MFRRYEFKHFLVRATYSFIVLASNCFDSSLISLTIPEKIAGLEQKLKSCIDIVVVPEGKKEVTFLKVFGSTKKQKSFFKTILSLYMLTVVFATCMELASSYIVNVI